MVASSRVKVQELFGQCSGALGGRRDGSEETRRAGVRRRLGALRAAAAAAAKKSKRKLEAEVGPAEDFMREHGVLRRMLFLYDEAARRLEAADKPPLDAVAAGARIVRKVIEDYHEKLEEN